MQSQAVKSLIDYFGGQVATGDALGVKQGTVSGWLNKKHGMKSLRAQKAEKLTGGEIKAINLCPDLSQLEKESTNVR